MGGGVSYAHDEVDPDFPVDSNDGDGIGNALDDLDEWCEEWDAVSKRTTFIKL